MMGTGRWAITLLGGPRCQRSGVCVWGGALPGGTARESMAAKPANGVPLPLESTLGPVSATVIGPLIHAGPQPHCRR